MRVLVVAALLLSLIVAACGESTPSSSSPASAAPAAAVPEATPAPRPTPGSTVSPTPTSSPTPSPSPSPSPKPATAITATKTVKHFKVYGAAPQQLLDSTVTHSKPVCGTSETLACVRQSRVVSWMTKTKAGTDDCRVESVAVKLASKVWLPRWVKPSSPPRALPAWWGKMLVHLTWHENQHIAIEKRYEAKLSPLVVGKACHSAQKIVRKWEKSVNAAQARFDKKDITWPYPAYP